MNTTVLHSDELRMQLQGKTPISLEDESLKNLSLITENLIQKLMLT